MHMRIAVLLVMDAKVGAHPLAHKQVLHDLSGQSNVLLMTQFRR